jgi:hypothetical protein
MAAKAKPAASTTKERRVVAPGPILVVRGK